MSDLARTLIVLGVLLVVVGLALLLVPKIPGLGKLPGDLVIKRENYTFYFPLGTCILISVILSLIFWLFRR
jgi:ribose/xylose/arabinose/galactoside ABC-type transport system permease subunit